MKIQSSLALIMGNIDVLRRKGTQTKGLRIFNGCFCPQNRVGELNQLIVHTCTEKLIIFHEGGFKPESTKIKFS